MIQCYERRLLDIIKDPNGDPDIGGHAFTVSDDGPPVTYGDASVVMSTLTDGETRFPELSPTLMLLVSHLFEAYYIFRYLLSNSPLSFLVRLIPPLGGDLVNLQPSIFAITNVHLIFDDSRARLPPSQGGIGYTPRWTTAEGLFKTYDAFVQGGGKGEARSMGGGVGSFFGLVKAQRGVERIREEIIPGAR